MSIYINELKVNNFRGIKKLDLKNLRDVNIIVGDNNVGKTSLLESILILRNPMDFNNMIRISINREQNYRYMYPSNRFESLLNLFNKNNDLTIDLSAKLNNEIVSFNLNGEIRQIMIDLKEVRGYYGKKSETVVETSELLCNLKYNDGILTKYQSFKFNRFTSITGRVLPDEFIKIIYLSPTDHLKTFRFTTILRDNNYKSICIKVLQIFDDKIEDLLLLEDDVTGEMINYIYHKELGNMPISTFGDGIKKVISLSNAIASASNSILLIDELETAIHAKYYDDILRFVLKAAKQFNVQLFITTHSIEALDGLLSTQKENGVFIDNNNISVITLRKDEDTKTTLSRVLTGKEVYDNREKFNFEVRS